MSIRQKQVAAVIIVACVAVTAVVAWNWRPANNANFPDGTFWICRNEACKAEFTLTMKQLSDHHARHYGEDIACPECEQTRTVRAERCPHCGKYYPMQREVTPCPECGKTPV